MRKQYIATAMAICLCITGCGTTASNNQSAEKETVVQVISGAYEEATKAASEEAKTEAQTEIQTEAESESVEASTEQEVTETKSEEKATKVAKENKKDNKKDNNKKNNKKDGNQQKTTEEAYIGDDKTPVSPSAPVVPSSSADKKAESTTTVTSNNNGGSQNNDNNNNSQPATQPVVQPSKSDIDLSEYHLVWADEFNGTSLNRDDWNVELHEPGWVNSELQEYVDSTDNIQVKNGELTIKPIKEEKNGKTTYTSGRINTQNKHDFTYGVFEVRAKVPAGAGYLPAFWLMATDENVYGQWPRCGEIDCMEVMGQNNKKVYGTIHYGNPHAESQGTYTLTSGNYTDEYHTFTTEWEPGKITWYVDGIKYHTTSDWHSTTEGQGTLSYPAPFDQPFYMILNLAVGGSWVGNPNSSTDFEDAKYVVDYVKVYQKDSYNENVEKPENKVVLRNPNADGNYINNGDFAVSESLTDDKDWKFLTALGGEATAEIKNNQMIIKTTAFGTEDYSVQLVQADVPFEKGATYKVSFDAYADAARSFRVDVKAPDRGYAKYMDSMNVDVTTKKQTFTQTFKMKSDSDANGRLEFNMGAFNSTETIYISNVVIEKIAEPTQDEEEKTVLSSGNYIYNGKFQEGKNHLGYWTVSDTDKVSVTDFSDGRRAKITLSENESVTLSQEKLAIVKDSKLALSFQAEATKNATVVVNVGGKELSFDLTNERKEYTAVVSGFENKNVAFTVSGEGVVYLDNISLTEDAMLKNGSFDSEFAGYEVYVDSSASASKVVDSLKEDNAASFTINNPGDQDWKIQLKQNNVKLVNGQWYKLTFKAKASVDRKIRVIMQGDEAHGWAVYSGDNTIELTQEYQTFEKVFKMDAATDEAAFLSVCMGECGDNIKTQHTVVVDDFSLVETEEPVEDDSQTSDNLVLNADFSANPWNDKWGTNLTEGTTAWAENGVVTFDIKSVGSNDWDVQLKQDDLHFKSGEKYQVTFDITSSEDRTIKTGALSSTYAWYNGDDVELKANEKKTVSFEINENNNKYAYSSYFCISMGQYENKVTPCSVIEISNIKLVRIGAPVEDTDKDENALVGTSEDVAGNMIANGTFNGKDAWIETIANWGDDYSTVANVYTDNNTLVADIENAGTANWHVQLKQEGITLEEGKTYRVRFQAQSTADREFLWGLQNEGYAQYKQGSVACTAGNIVTVDETFKITNSTDTNMTFYLSLGKTDGKETPASIIRIANVSLVEVETASTEKDVESEPLEEKDKEAIIEDSVEEAEKSEDESEDETKESEDESEDETKESKDESEDENKASEDKATVETKVAEDKAEETKEPSEE